MTSTMPAGFEDPPKNKPKPRLCARCHEIKTNGRVCTTCEILGVTRAKRLREEMRTQKTN